MVEIRDTGAQFHWSRPRIVGIVFAAVALPIFLVLAVFGHDTIGIVASFAACFGLTIAYFGRTPLRSFMQRLIPTTAEKADRSRDS